MAFGRAPFGGTPFGGGRTSGTATVVGTTTFKRKAGKTGTISVSAVKGPDGSELRLSISTGTYTTSDPNEIWILRNLFSEYVEG